MVWVDINKLLENDFEFTEDEKIAKREMEKVPNLYKYKPNEKKVKLDEKACKTYKKKTGRFRCTGLSKV